MNRWAIVVPCPGPIIWFKVGQYNGLCECGFGAVLLCSSCREIFTTGDFLDDAHANTPVLTSPK